MCESGVCVRVEVCVFKLVKALCVCDKVACERAVC